uniref:Small integral membrane protein 1 (Vel blood group) n=1 Tax=Panthera tigris altaica TaxID=74533 RepID=A0A8C9K6E1_PANTA
RPTWESGTHTQSPAAHSGSRAGGSLSRISRKLCSGKLGIALKVLGGVALFWAVFILGYVTGYYVHKCK